MVWFNELKKLIKDIGHVHTTQTRKLVFLLLHRRSLHLREYVDALFSTDDYHSI